MRPEMGVFPGEALGARGVLVLEFSPVGRDVAAYLGHGPQVLRGPVRPSLVNLTRSEVPQVDSMPLREDGARSRGGTITQ